MFVRADIQFSINIILHFGYPICSLLIYSFPDTFFFSPPQKKHGMQPASLLAKIGTWGHKAVNPAIKEKWAFLTSAWPQSGRPYRIMYQKKIQ